METNETNRQDLPEAELRQYTLPTAECRRGDILYAPQLDEYFLIAVDVKFCPGWIEHHALLVSLLTGQVCKSWRLEASDLANTFTHQTRKTIAEQSGLLLPVSNLHKIRYGWKVVRDGEGVPVLLTPRRQGT